jgi:hypothetical protein
MILVLRGAGHAKMDIRTEAYHAQILKLTFRLMRNEGGTIVIIRIGI